MKKNTAIYLAEFIPIILFYIFFVHSDEMLDFSNTLLGRAFAVGLIVFYSSINTIYGIAMCILVIFFYQTDMVQGNASFLQTPEFYVFDMSTREGFDPPSVVNEFRKENCSGSQLMHKNKPVRNENAHHLFPELKFSPNFACNPCDPGCKISIIESRLSAQEELTYPKPSDDWVNGVWRTWFGSDSQNTPSPRFSEAFGAF
jgi:hypothetical protein